jgi:hypothetical protein
MPLSLDSNPLSYRRAQWWFNTALEVRIRRQAEAMAVAQRSDNTGNYLDCHAKTGAWIQFLDYEAGAVGQRIGKHVGRPEAELDACVRPCRVRVDLKRTDRGAPGAHVAALVPITNNRWLLLDSTSAQFQMPDDCHHDRAKAALNHPAVVNSLSCLVCCGTSMQDVFTQWTVHLQSLPYVEAGSVGTPMLITRNDAIGT